jgi:putative transposase
LFKSDLSHQGCLSALKMALRNSLSTSEGLIHHSDRGVQYCCSQYVALLIKSNIQISMTEKSDPYENPVAERVNGILKSELSIDRIFKDHAHALRIVEQQIKTYNNLRPHASCDFYTPSKAHSMTGVLKKRWKSKTRPSP